MKNINYKNILAIAVLIIGFAPIHAFAATVYMESSRNTISVGDTAIVSVKVNAEGAVLNSIEGDIVLKSTAGNLAIKEFSLASSSFGLWPRTPSLSADGRTVSFVGGVPGGFSIEGATVFKIIVQATKVGNVSINPQNLSIYLNDGKGTKAPVQIRGINIQIDPKKAGSVENNDWSSIVSKDNIPPSPFIVVAGQDNSLFSGKKFVFFSAVDNQTGIDHYDVSENGGPVVRSGSTYVLQDQSGNATLNVVAYDKAGNKTIAAYSPKSSNGSVNWMSVFIIVIVLIIIYFIYTKISRRKK